MDKITFYEGIYAPLSNFSAHRVVFERVDYMTAEHAYQVAKFSDSDLRERIKNAPSAFLAREYGQAENGRIENFDKVAVMKEIMRAKLSQHKDVQEILLSTGTATIDKNHPEDSFWGSGADGTGQNVMGKIWMELRDEIQ